MRSCRLAPGTPSLLTLLFPSVLAAVGCTVHSDPVDLAGQDVRLTIIHTADIHSRLFPYQFAPGQIDKDLGLLPSHGDIAIVGGIARIATVIQRERAASQRVLHLDSGDIFEGAPVFNTFNGEVEMRAMSRLGVNAMALGNHEFDKGSANLELMKEKWGAFPILASNYEFSDPNDPTQPKLRDVIAPFQIFNVQGLRVGVIGLGNLSSLEGIFEGGNSLGVVPLDSNQTVQTTVNLIRSQVDLVILLSHMGLDEDEAAAQTNAAGTVDVSQQNPVTAGVDVTLGGHLHIVLNPPKEIPLPNDPTSRIILCHSGAFAKYVGRLDLSVHVASRDVGKACKADSDCTGGAHCDMTNAVCADKPGVKSYTYKLIPIDDSIPEDADMANMLEPYQLKMNTMLNLTHNYAVIPCPPNVTTCPKVVRSDPDGGDSQLGNLVAQSMRVRPRVEADFALTNSLGIRADFESGPLNLEEMYNVFPFDNTITTMFLSGNEIQTMLDFVASRSSQRGCKSQAQVAGIWFVADCTNQISCGPFDTCGDHASTCRRLSTATHEMCPNKVDPGGNPVVRADGPFLLGDDCLNNPVDSTGSPRCRPVLPGGEYRVAVNDYIAAGGSGFAVLKRNTTKFNTGISLRDSLIDYITEQNTRCDVSQYTNLIGVQCVDAHSFDPLNGGTSYDCSANCACADPTTGVITAASASCQFSKAPTIACTVPGANMTMQLTPYDCCQQQGYQPRAFDNSNLPCLDSTLQPHDGRVTMVGGT